MAEIACVWQYKVIEKIGGFFRNRQADQVFAIDCPTRRKLPGDHVVANAPNELPLMGRGSVLTIFVF